MGITQSCGEAVSILQGAHGTASYLADVFDYLEMQVEAVDDADQAGWATRKNCSTSPAASPLNAVDAQLKGGSAAAA